MRCALLVLHKVLLALELRFSCSAVWNEFLLLVLHNAFRVQQIHKRGAAPGPAQRSAVSQASCVPLAVPYSAMCPISEFLLMVLHNSGSWTRKTCALHRTAGQL